MNGPPPAVAILDSVCAIYFTASGQIQLLIDTLNAAGHTVLIPSEITEEADNRMTKNGWNPTGLRQSIGAGIHQIPELTAATGGMDLFGKIRRDHPAGTVGGTNLGECFVVTRAVQCRTTGSAVVVAVDDGDAQRLAQAHDLDVVTIEDILVKAVELGVTTKAGAKAAYEKMLPFGNSLPSWDAAVQLKKRLGYHK